MSTEKLNKGVFYSLRVIALFYLIAALMMLVVSLSQGSNILLGLFAGLFVAVFMYLFYRASEEAKLGTNLGRVLTGICGLIFLLAFIAGAGNGMKWLGLLLALYWIYKFFDWESAEN